MPRSPRLRTHRCVPWHTRPRPPNRDRKFLTTVLTMAARAQVSLKDFGMFKPDACTVFIIRRAAALRSEASGLDVPQCARYFVHTHKALVRFQLTDAFQQCVHRAFALFGKTANVTQHAPFPWPLSHRCGSPAAACVRSWHGDHYSVKSRHLAIS